MSAAYPLRTFTVDEYYALARAGILREDERTELLDGTIVAMSPIGRRHAACVKRLNTLFSSVLQDAVILSIQNPIRLGRFSEPEPDVALLKRRGDFYAEGHPGPEDVLLVIEVADTTLLADRAFKAPLYARHGLRELWIVAVDEGFVEVYRSPGATGYSDVQTYGRTDVISPVAFPECSFPLAPILG